MSFSGTGTELVDIDSFLDDYLGELRDRSRSDPTFAGLYSHTDSADRLAALFATTPVQPVQPETLAGVSSTQFSNAIQRSKMNLEPEPNLNVSASAQPSTSHIHSTREHSNDSFCTRDKGIDGNTNEVDFTDKDDKAAKQARRAQALQEKNRRAQRRFRERQKAKVSELEAQVAGLNQRINNLMVVNANLESRNNILEKVVGMKDEKLRKLRELRKTPSSMQEEEEMKGLMVSFEDQLTLTLREGQQITLTAEEVKDLSKEDLVKFWKEYVNQLAHCLVEAGHDPKGPAAEKVTQLTNEACMLIMRVALVNPTGSKTWSIHKMEDTATVPGIDNYEMWPTILRSMNLTKSQKREMVQLRRLFLNKLLKIVDQRREINGILATAIPAGAASREAAVEFLKAHESIEKLKNNLRDEHLLVLDFVSTLLTHVLNQYQVARCIVQAYPWSPDCLALCTWVAAEVGEADAVNAVTRGTAFAQPVLATPPMEAAQNARAGPPAVIIGAPVHTNVHTNMHPSMHQGQVHHLAAGQMQPTHLHPAGPAYMHTTMPQVNSITSQPMSPQLVPNASMNGYIPSTAYSQQLPQHMAVLPPSGPSVSAPQYAHMQPGQVDIASLIAGPLGSQYGGHTITTGLNT